jgi:cell division protein FtsL
LSSWFAEAAVAEPVARPRAKPKPKPKAKPRAKAKARQRARARSGVLWIAVSGVLLAGVVFVNVAVLQLNLRLDKANVELSQLRADNNTLGSQLSSELASPRIQKQAQQDGLVQADPSTFGYINLAK